MQLNVMINEEEFSDVRKNIKKINEFITLYIQDEIGYIENGIIKKEDAHFFGKLVCDDLKYQLLTFGMINDNKHDIEFADYENEAQRFVEKWSKVDIIKIKGESVE